MSMSKTAIPFLWELSKFVIVWGYPRKPAATTGGQDPIDLLVDRPRRIIDVVRDMSPYGDHVLVRGDMSSYASSFQSWQPIFFEIMPKISTFFRCFGGRGIGKCSG